jgi:polyferredoxin
VGESLSKNGTLPAKGAGRSSSRKSFFIRLGVQVFFFLLVAGIALNQKLEEMRMTISWLPTTCLHAICPFGGVETLYQLATAGSYVQKIEQSALVLMVMAFVLAVVAGPLFCGWICPFGSFQEWLGKLGRKLFKKKFNAFIPARLDSYLRFVRYGVLALILVATALSAKLIFADYDPYHALFRFYSGEVAIGALVVLGAVIVASLFVERPFCKYACPYGALLGLFNFFSIFPLRRKASSCINCKACDRSCPMNITVSSAGTIRDHQCISCLKCTSEGSCPVADTVALSATKL